MLTDFKSLLKFTNRLAGYNVVNSADGQVVVDRVGWGRCRAPPPFASAGLCTDITPLPGRLYTPASKFVGFGAHRATGGAIVVLAEECKSQAVRI